MKVQSRQVPSTPFPYKGSIREQMRYLLRYAVQAPSMYNSQPWRFRLTDAGVDVLADRTRLPLADDPDGRGLLLAIGAAIHHLTIAMRCHGLEPVLWYPPMDGTDPDHLASVRVGGTIRPTNEDLELLGEILRRHAPQAPSETTHIGEYALMTLRRSMIGSGSGLVFIDQDWLIDLVAEETEAGDELLANCSQVRLQIAKRRHDNARRGDSDRPSTGLDAPGATTRLALGFLSQTDFGLDHRLSDASEGIASPAVAMLYTGGNSATDLLETGRSLGCLALNAGHFGLKVSPRYELWDVPGLFDRLRQETRLLGFPQLIVRVGFAELAFETPRLTLDRVIEDSGASWPPDPSESPRSDAGPVPAFSLR